MTVTCESRDEVCQDGENTGRFIKCFRGNLGNLLRF